MENIEKIFRNRYYLMKIDKKSFLKYFCYFYFINIFIIFDRKMELIDLDFFKVLFLFWGR